MPRCSVGLQPKSGASEITSSSSFRMRRPPIVIRDDHLAVLVEVHVGYYALSARGVHVRGEGAYLIASVDDPATVLRVLDVGKTHGDRMLRERRELVRFGDAVRVRVLPDLNVGVRGIFGVDAAVLIVVVLRERGEAVVEAATHLRL